MDFDAPRKKKSNVGLLLLALLAGLALVFGKKGGVSPPSPKPILRSVGEPDISPAGPIQQGSTKTFMWQCQNTGDADGLALLQLDEVSPTPIAGILLGVAVPIAVGQTVMLDLSGAVNLLPNIYSLKILMIDATTVAQNIIDSRITPLTVNPSIPVAVLTGGTWVIT